MKHNMTLAFMELKNAVSFKSCIHENQFNWALKPGFIQGF